MDGSCGVECYFITSPDQIQQNKINKLINFRINCSIVSIFSSSKLWKIAIFYAEGKQIGNVHKGYFQGYPKTIIKAII